MLCRRFYAGLRACKNELPGGQIEVEIARPAADALGRLVIKIITKS